MKSNLNNRLGLAISTVVLLGVLNSCVKNRNLAATDFSQIQPIVELVTGNPTSGVPSTSKSLVLSLAAPTVTERIYVNYAALTTAPKDITVKLSIDQAGLTAYDLAPTLLTPPQPALNYVMLNSNAYTFNPTVIIHAGQQFGYVDITFYPSLVNLAVTNALSINITDASGVLISANYAHYIYKVNVKSPYEAVYTLKGSSLRAGDPVLSGPLGPTTRTLITESANSVRMFENRTWSNNSTSGLAAPFGNPWYTVDPATNLVYLGDDNQSIGTGVELKNNPGRTSHYDPATRTFYVYGTWNTGNGGGPGVREMNDTLTYLRDTP